MSAAEIEVLEPGERSARELMDDANREHGLVLGDGASLVEHAIRCGDALLAAEARYIEESAHRDLPPWLEFAHENFKGGHNRLHTYMRLARYQHVVRAKEFDSINGAMVHLVETGAKNNTGRKAPPEWLVAEMKKLRAEGLTIKQVAEQVGRNRGYVQFWTSDPEAREAKRAKSLEAWRRKQAAAKALAEKERERAVKQVLRKAGAAEQELYAMCEKLQDVLGQAHREATDPEKRRHYALMGEHYRKMRDEGVRALGIA